jgi:hypothetical protein
MSNFAAVDLMHQATPTNFDNLDAGMAFRSDGQAVSRQGDDKLYVKFYSKAIKDEAKSQEAGRAIFKDTLFINIKMPGDKHNDVNRIAFPEDIQRFPVHFERFKRGQEQVVGTPLSALPFLTEVQVEEYASMFIKTVEQLAGLPDVQAQKILGSITHKQQAQAWLDSFKGAERLRAEFEEQRKADAEKMAAMQAQLDALTKTPKAAPVK